MEITKDLIEKIYKIISSAKADGKLRRGANEATKSVERGEAKLVIYAEDVSPPEVIMHFSAICKERDIACVAIPSKTELGAAAGLPVSTAAVAVAIPGDKKLLDEVVKSLKALSTTKAAPKETPAKEEKLVEKKEQLVGEKATEKVSTEEKAVEEKKEEAPAKEEKPSEKPEEKKPKKAEEKESK